MGDRPGLPRKPRFALQGPPIQVGNKFPSRSRSQISPHSGYKMFPEHLAIRFVPALATNNKVRFVARFPRVGMLPRSICLTRRAGRPGTKDLYSRSRTQRLRFIVCKVPRLYGISFSAGKRNAWQRKTGRGLKSRPLHPPKISPQRPCRLSLKGFSPSPSALAPWCVPVGLLARPPRRIR